MRCIIVSDGSLKADAHCAYCHRRISDSYVRKIGTCFVYCDYGCYQNAEEFLVPARNLPVISWTVNS